MKIQKTNRRGFIKNASAGVGMVGLGGGHQILKSSDGDGKDRKRLPREVWVASITLGDIQGESYEENIELLLKRMDEVSPYQPDIVCLPEIAPFIRLSKRPPIQDVAEQGLGPITSRFASYAKENHCYVIIPLYTKENGLYYNASVLIDREGAYAGEYRKIYLTAGEMGKGLTPGPTDPPVFNTDFGVIGMQICFDLQFFDGFKRLGEKGAEIVFWPSAYCGGRQINTVAWMNRIVVVASTRYDPVKICDIDGSDVVSSSYRSKHWICEPINLEKVMITKWPHGQKIDAIIKKYGRKVRITIHEEEVWAIIESLSPDVRVANLLEEFDIDGLRSANELAESMYKTHRIHP
jgi:beta-ureidopropionase